MNIGASIKELRIERKLSQKQLAEKIDISATSLCLIESGTKRPSHRTIKKLCQALKIKEPLLYILAIEEKDIPKSLRNLLKRIFPSIKSVKQPLTSKTKSHEPRKRTQT